MGACSPACITLVFLHPFLITAGNDGMQVPVHEMMRFLDTGWEPALSTSEREWILQRFVLLRCPACRRQ